MAFLSNNDRNELRRLRRKVDGISGAGVKNDRDAIIITRFAEEKPNTHPLQDDMFLVKITKDGGTDGSGTTAATWTYTVNDRGGETLGTNVQRYFTRSKGKMDYAPDNSFALAFYDDDGVLWLALTQEAEVFGQCS